MHCKICSPALLIGVTTDDIDLRWTWISAKLKSAGYSVRQDASRWILSICKQSLGYDAIL